MMTNHEVIESRSPLKNVAAPGQASRVNANADLGIGLNLAYCLAYSFDVVDIDVR